MSSQNRIGLILAVVVTISALAVVLTHGSGASAAGRTDDVNVECGPTQRAVVRQEGATDGITIACVEATPTPNAVPAGAAAPDPAAWTPGIPAAAPVAYAPAAMAPAPAICYPARAAQTVVDAPVERPQVRREAAPVRAPRAEPKPSTKERLLIIGGSAGAGAGIGALIGGKKGALIGAAIGGGGAAVVDQVRND